MDSHFPGGSRTSKEEDLGIQRGNPSWTDVRLLFIYGRGHC